MKTSDLTNLTPPELAAHRDKLEQDYTRLRQAVWAGREKNNAKLRALRREIARVHTVAVSHSHG